MAQREARAKKNSSISSVSSSHEARASQSTKPRPAQQSTLRRNTSTLPAVSMPKPESAWERNACVRVTGRACISPTVRVVIRYDHTAIAMKQPNSSDMTTEPYTE